MNYLYNEPILIKMHLEDFLRDAVLDSVIFPKPVTSNQLLRCDYKFATLKKNWRFEQSNDGGRGDSR